MASDPGKCGRSAGASAWLGVRRATPLAISSGLLGILYGAACVSLGISPTLAALACVLVFSGAVQFAVLGLLAEPASFAAITVSSLLICNRLILMGASIAVHLRDQPWPMRVVAMAVLTDGAWAATIAERTRVDRYWFFVCAGIWILLLWVAGTLLGTIIAANLDAAMITKMRFAGVLFLALLLLLVVRNTSMTHMPWVASALVSMIASNVVPLFLAFLIGVTAGATIAWYQETEEPSDHN